MDPVGGVHAEDVRVAGRVGAEEIFFRGDSFGHESFGDETEFLRGEDVRAEVQVVAFVIDEFEGKHFLAPRVPSANRRTSNSNPTSYPTPGIALTIRG